MNTENIEALIEEAELEMTPPDAEPQRQYYFIKRARQLVEEKNRAAGRQMTFCVRTFGCQMNARDSEKLTGILQTIGYRPIDAESADFVVFNTCTVRENANNKVYGHLGYLHGYKKKNPYMTIALCGCMMQEDTVVEKIRTSYPFVDLVFGTHNLYRFAELVCAALEQEKMVIEVWKDKERIVEHLPNRRKYRFKTGVNVTYGCNNFCSYCIVPYVRGRERSRTPQEILDEIRDFAKDGVLEVMLLGQNVNSYGKTLEEPVSFARLLQMTEEIDGIERIRFMTSHPKDLSDELIAVMRDSKKICGHLHLPLQSGSSRILERMNRRYDKDGYLRLVDRIKTAMPDIALTTDIIVGFPGETEADFEDTMDVVERVRFDSAFTFIYSKRTGTPAASMPDQVDPQVIDERFDRLLQTVQRIGAEAGENPARRVQPVLIEEINRQNHGFVTGRLENNRVVHLPGDESLIGQIISVELTECRGFYYIGKRV